MDRLGISLPEHLRFTKFWSVFDFESLLVANRERDDATTLNVHIPVSVSIASNVPRFTDVVCMVSSGDPQELVNKFLNYLIRMSDAAEKLKTEMYSPYIKALEHLVGEDGKKKGGNPRYQKSSVKCLNSLSSHLSHLPIVGFNSGKYDLHLIKPYLLKFYNREHSLVKPLEEEREIDIDGDIICPIAIEEELELEEVRDSFKNMLRKGNKIIALFTEKLKFLDVSNFLAPHTNYV